MKLSRLRQIFDRAIRILTGYLTIPFNALSRIDQEQVLFIPFQDGYTCNLKYICEEMRQTQPGFKLYWSFRNPDKSGDLPDGIKSVKAGSLKYYRVLSSSAIVVENAFNIVKFPVHKKKGQTFYQTMHGSLGIKRIDPESGRSAFRNRRGFRSAGLSDYIISNSTFEDNVYRTSFWENTPVLRLGHARNDILFAAKESEEYQAVRQRVYGFYGLDDSIHTVLFAPTYDAKGSFGDSLDIDRLCRVLSEARGGEWKVIVRGHPSSKNEMMSLQEKDGTVCDGSLWPDIQELMIAVDIGITDYSSWIFDFVLTGKPGFLYAPDQEQYEKRVGLYYPLSQTPFPIAHDNDEMEIDIRQFSEAEYQSDVDAFIDEKGCIDDGKASSRIVSFMISEDEKKTEDQ